MWTKRATLAAAIVMASPAFLVPVVLSTANAVTAPSCAAAMPGETAAQAMAKVCGRRVEVSSGRSERAQVFAEPSGALVFEASVIPKRVLRGGVWVDIDTTLRMGPGGRWIPGPTQADVSFSPGGTSPFAVLHRDGHEFSLAWPGPLPTPAVTANAAVYPDVVSGVDLRVMATFDGFREVLVVRSAAAAANLALNPIRLVVGGDGAVQTTAQGGLRVRAGGSVLAESGGALMWDSGIDPALNAAGSSSVTSSAHGPSQLARRAPVAIAVTGGDLKLSPDAALLTGGAAQYPLFIDPDFSTGYTTWAYSNNANVNFNTTDPWNGELEAYVGRNPPDGKVFRSFFDFPMASGTQTFKNRHVINAKVHANLDHSWACTDTAVDLYRTGGIASTPRTAWGAPALEAYIASASVHANEDSCGQPDQPFDFTGAALTADVQALANSPWYGYTVGLLAGSYAAESAQERWKRFHLADFALIVEYNSYPGTPVSLSAAGVACGGGRFTIGTTTPTLSATVVDEDTTQMLTTTFAWLQIPANGVYSDTTPLLPPAPTNVPNRQNGQAATQGLSGLQNGKSYAWRARTTDPYGDGSPWTPWCEFTVDTQGPAAPQIASTDYPADGLPHGGPGVAGAFTFTANDSTAVRYRWGWTSPPTKIVATTNGAPMTVQLTPPTYAGNVLYVISEDAVGNPSLTSSHQFTVDRPSPAIAAWRLEQWPNEAAQALTDQSGGGHDLTGTSVTWTGDARLIGSSTATFAVGSHADTSAVVDTTKSFSVAAWARLSTTTGVTTKPTVVSQHGLHTAAFKLRYNGPDNRWSFAMAETDGTNPILDAVVSDPATPPVAGRWTHLVGTYDAPVRKLSLYVDGALQADTDTLPTGFNGQSGLAVGRQLFDDAFGNSFLGSIADVRVWDRVVVPEDFTGSTVLDEPGMFAPNEVGRYAMEAGFEDTAPWGRNLTPTAEDWGFVESGRIGFGLQLNLDEWNTSGGKTGYAAAAGPVVRTDTSFTVSAWVKLADAGDSRAAVAQDGVNARGFSLGYSAPTNRWSLTMAGSDTTGATLIRAVSVNPPAVGTWVHLTGVYDARTGLRLYVNGVLDGTNASKPGWHAGGLLRVGRTTLDAAPSDYWYGDVDEVRIFAGAMNDAQVARLYSEF